jgi:sulfite exporter TauE/SafE
MYNSIITILQLFGIGFGFGIAGPCLLVCAPVLTAYISGRSAGKKEMLLETTLFMSGRVLAYLMLGAIAGLSGMILRRVTGEAVAGMFRPASGLISIMLGVFVLAGNRPGSILCGCSRNKFLNLGGLFALGFTIGIVPCAPLSALMLEIALMSRNVFDGAAYAISFGLGTAFSGVIVIFAISGLIRWLPAALLGSNGAKMALRAICALLLVVIGLGMMIS